MAVDAPYDVAHVLPPVRAALPRRLTRFVATRAFSELRADLATEAERGTGIVAFTVLFAAGAAVYFALPTEPPAWWLATALLVAVAAAVCARGAGRASAILVLALSLGAAAGAFETWRTATKMLGGDINTRLTGRVVAVEERGGGRARVTLDVVATERPTLRYAPDRVRVTARSLPESLLPGDVVRGAVRLLPPTGPVRPQAFDFSFETYFSGIGASGFFLTEPVAVQTGAQPGFATRLAASVERFREGLADHIRARIAGSEGEIAAALIAGVRGGIPEEDNEALRRTGLAHFISISGLHMALVAAIVLFAVRGGLALFPLFASRHPTKKYAALAALAATGFYLVISGQQVAAQRSFIMFAVMLVAVLFDRAALTMRNLALSALAILAVAPHEVMGPSFQMSFAATAALIASYAWFAERRRAWPQQYSGAEPGRMARAVRWALLFLGGLAATSLIAGAATAIFGVWHFQRVSPLGLLANLGAMPVVTFVVMPAALAGSLLTPLGLDAPFFALMGWGLSVVMDVARFLSERTPLDAVGAIPASAVVTLTAALALGSIATTRSLRLLSLPLLAVGLGMAAARGLPDVLISEDGRLVAVLGRDGRLAVNRNRPSAFTTENWLHALAAGAVVKPGKRAGPGAFQCDGGLCLATHDSGAVVAHAGDAASAQGACGQAVLIVIDDATASLECPGAAVVTKRDLALRGSASIVLHGADALPSIAFAIGPSPRIWHDQRRFSREARGLAPYRRPDRTGTSVSTSGSAQPADPGP